jgi:hypothetical protein
MPLTTRDIEVVTACAQSLPAFYVRHQSLLEGSEAVPVSESYFDENEREVCFTFPYDGWPLAFFDNDVDFAEVEPAASTPRAPKVGRNDPCPCGSGRKYKKCHLAIDEMGRPASQDAESSHRLDQRLCTEMTDFAVTRFGEEWLAFEDDFQEPLSIGQLAGHWALFHFSAGGRTVADRYLEEHGPRLSNHEREWLTDECKAWLSTWEVVAVDAGASVTLRDLLSGETRLVLEKNGSRSLMAGDTLLARVVDHQGTSLLCGVHPRPLPLSAAEAVIGRARGRLRLRRDVPLDRLRDEKIGRLLIASWEATLEEIDEEQSPW